MSNDRAQSVVIGSTLIFAMLIVSFSFYQAFVIPQQNEAIEQEHSQTVLNDMSNLRTALISLSETGGTRSASVKLGTNYPSRMFGVNPSPPGGTLQTQTNGQMYFDDTFNTTAVCGYEPTTRSLIYRPTYNVYDNEPTTVYENSILYRNYSGDYVVYTNQTLINDRMIFLPPLNRTYNRGGTETVSVTLKAGPQGGATNQSDQEVTLTIPSRLPPRVWENNDRLFGSVDAVKSVQEADETKFPNSINVTLEDGLYTVKCRAVGIEQYPVSGQSVPLSLAGPATENLSLSPSTVTKGDKFSIKATVTDANKGGTSIEAAEWRDETNTDHAGKMVASDGKYDQVVETVENRSIDTDGWSTGDHTIQVRGRDAQGNIGGWTDVTLTVESAAGTTLIQGIAYKDSSGGDVAIYQYDTGSVHDSGFSAKSAIGGILDWDDDGSVDDVAYRTNNKHLAIYDKSAGTNTEYSFDIAKSLGFTGDFNDDGNATEIPYFLSSNNGLEVANNTDAGLERFTVVDAATGNQITVGTVSETQITGTADIDGDGEPEFAYVNGDSDLVVADVVSVSSSEIRVRRQVVSATTSDNVEALGGIGDLDDDGMQDDIPIKMPTSYSNNKYIRYYDFSRDALFLYEDTVPNELGPTLDTDGDGKDELYFVDSNGELVYREVGDSTVVTVTVSGSPISVKNDVIGGGN